MTENKMRTIRIEKVVLSIGATAEDLEKGTKLLKLISGMKAIKTKSRKRIPSLGVRPGLEVGCKVTMRGEKAIEVLKKLLETVNNEINPKQISEGTLSFGIKEYIEIQGIEYQRDIGIIGFDVSISFTRSGKRVEVKKIKRGKLPKKQRVTKKEILEYMKNNFQINKEEEK